MHISRPSIKFKKKEQSHELNGVFSLDLIPSILPHLHISLTNVYILTKISITTVTNIVNMAQIVYLIYSP